jgi:hypothetical protein
VATALAARLALKAALRTRRGIGVLFCFSVTACDSLEPKAVTRGIQQEELVGHWFLPRLGDLVRSDAPPERSLTLLADGRCVIGSELWTVIKQCVSRVEYPEATLSSPAPCTWRIAANPEATFVELAVAGKPVPWLGSLEVREGGYLADETGLTAWLCEGDEVEETYLARVPL